MIIDLDPEDTTVADSEPERELLAYRAGSAAFSDVDDGRTVYPVASTEQISLACAVAKAAELSECLDDRSRL